jgi:hypothetical protein
MPVKRRTNKRHAALTETEAAWLRGERESGFVEFKRPEELQKLWDSHGDHDELYWNPGMSWPEMIEASL